MFLADFVSLEILMSGLFSIQEGGAAVCCILVGLLYVVWLM